MISGLNSLKNEELMIEGNVKAKRIERLSIEQVISEKQQSC